MRRIVIIANGDGYGHGYGDDNGNATVFYWRYFVMSSGNSRFKKLCNPIKKVLLTNPEYQTTGDYEARHSMATAHHERMIADVRKARQEGMKNPVALLCDMSGKYGKLIAEKCAKLEGKPITWRAAYVNECLDKGKIPTLHLVISWDVAQRIMPFTSPTASANLRQYAKMMDKIRQDTGKTVSLGIIIGQSGNTYSILVD